MGPPGFLTAVLSQVWSEHEGWAIQTDQTRLASQENYIHQLSVSGRWGKGLGKTGTIPQALLGQQLSRHRGWGWGRWELEVGKWGVQDCH